MSTIVLQILLIAVLIVFSAFFSGSEIAYSGANRLRLKSAAESGRHADGLAFRIYESFDRTLITILVGNNLVNVASSSVATVIAIALLGDDGTFAATGVMTVIILAFGEIMPKILAAQAPEKFARLVAYPLRAMCVMTYPLVFVVEKLCSYVDRLWAGKLPDGPSVTEDDLENIFDTAEDEGIMDEDRCDLLQSALDFDDVLAYEIITPRVDMLAIDVDDPTDEIIAQVSDAPYSRIPVYEDTVDNIIGILHLDHLFKDLALAHGEKKDIDVRNLMLPVRFVHKTMPLPDVLKVMKKHKCHMVIVTDEYGGTMGLLTMEDVLEQLVGDIWDESDEVTPEFTELAENKYAVDGDMRTEDLFEELDMDERDFDDDNATLGGWAIEMLGGYPRPGDRFDYRNLTITVDEMKNLRVTRLLIDVHPVAEEEEEL